MTCADEQSGPGNDPFEMPEDYGDSRGAAESEKAKAYNRAKRILFVIELAAGLIFLILLLFSGISVGLARWLENAAGNPWMVVLLYLLAVGFVYEFIAVPLDFYGGYVLEHAYGQSTQTFFAWTWDMLKGKLVGLVIGIPLLETVYWLLRRFPESWWIITTLIFVAFGVVIANLAPVILMPIFYTFVPLRNEKLRERLVNLCEKVKTQVRGVYEMDLSRKTRAANAALVGLGNTRRIVLGDTLLDRYDPDEIEVVLAHELGHHKHWDIWRGLIFQSGISALGFYVAYRVLNACSRALGLSGPADIGGFPLLMLTIAAVSLIFLPVANAFSRHLERQADAFALKLTANPKAFVSMTGKLGRQNLAEFEPNAIIEFILHSHPSIGKRIRMARRMFPNEFEDADG